MAASKRDIDASVTGEAQAAAKKLKLGDEAFQPRSYQMEEVFEIAKQRNTIATGSGNTMIAIMLINEMKKKLNAPGSNVPPTRIILFLAPTVQLVNQQAEVIKCHTDLNVGVYCSDKGISQWNKNDWENEMSNHQVMALMPHLLLDALEKGFLSLDMVLLMILDECHHVMKKHVYSRIMEDYYKKSVRKPRIFGMTASSLVTKGDSSAVVYESQLSNLESTLNAKIYAVVDKSEMHFLVPEVKDLTRYYDPQLSIHENLKTKLGSLYAKFDASISTMKGLPLDENKDVDGRPKASRSLSTYHSKISNCLDNLGLICAKEAAKFCMENMRPPCPKEVYNNFLGRVTVEGYDNLLGRATQYKNYMEEVSCTIEEGFSHDYEMLLKTEVGSANAMQLGYISPKLYTLMQIFQSFSVSKQVLCLIFVDKAATARYIEFIIKKVGYLSHFMVGYLTARSSSKDALKHDIQRETLDAFRSGKVNLLFTTDEAQEGLDICACSCVIRYDLPKTVCSYVQSRGRARDDGSLYIIMPERGNIQQRDLLFGLIRSKYSMMNTSLSREQDAIYDNKMVCDEKVNANIVESSGSTITADSSTNIIFRYCEELPRDGYLIPKPLFQFACNDGSYTCTLTLPPNAAFPTLVGPENRNPLVAKQLVCFEACKKLYQLGLSHLCPSIEEPMKTKLDRKIVKSASGPGTMKRKELHESAPVHAISGTWMHQGVGVTLQGYKLLFSCDQVGQHHGSFILLIDSILDEDISCLEINLYSSDKIIKASVSSCGPIHLDSEQLEQAKQFHELLFNGLFGKLFIASNPSGASMEFVPKEDSSLWRTSNVFLLLPLETGHDVGINWKEISASASLVNFLRSIKLPGGQSDKFRTDASSLLHRSDNSDMEFFNSQHTYLANKFVCSPKDMVVVAIHSGKIYSVLEVLTDSCADSNFEDDAGKGSSKFTTYSDFFKKKYGIVLQHPKQPLLLLKQSHNPRNFLSRSSNSEGDSDSRKKYTSTVRQCHARMPPELLVHIDISEDVLNSFYLLPSVMYRMETLMLASQLRKEIGFSNSRISSGLILEAITTPRSCEEFSMKRLELLGDSVLKYILSCYLFVKFPEDHEGKLSTWRSRIVCNANLHKLGTKRNIQGYIRDAAFDPCRWVAPGQMTLHPVTCKCEVDTEDKAKWVDSEDLPMAVGVPCDRGHRWICSETICNCVEALVGAYYVGGGLSASLAVLKWFGIKVEVGPEEVDEIIRITSTRSWISKLDQIKFLEAELGYEFIAKGLVLEAVTHESYELGASYSYQRLEFLGDAVLDFLITWHFFKCYTDISPGKLTDLRSASVNNDKFARIAVRHKFYECLQHNSGLLSEQIKKFVKMLEDSDNANSSRLLKGSSIRPKVLGDIVESIAAAILIDTKLNLDKVWEVFDPILSPIVTAGSLDLPPVGELTKLCSQLGYFPKTHFKDIGDRVEAMIEVQLETVLLARVVSERNGKAAREQAAILLLNDLEVLGFWHRQGAAKRIKNDETQTNVQSIEESSCRTKVMDISQSSEKELVCDVKHIEPVHVKYRNVKGGARSALYESSCHTKVTGISQASKKELVCDVKHIEPVHVKYKNVKGGARSALYESSCHTKIMDVSQSSEKELVCDVKHIEPVHVKYRNVKGGARSALYESSCHTKVTGILQSSEKKLVCDVKHIEPVHVKYRNVKGGARSALHDLCKKVTWPSPEFVITEEKQSLASGYSIESKNGPSSTFVAHATMNLPDHTVIQLTGAGCPGKNGSKDLVCMDLLLELEKQGRISLELIS